MAVSDVPSVLQVVLPLCIVGLGTGNVVLGDFKDITFHDGVLTNATSGIVCVSSIGGEVCGSLLCIDKSD